MYLYGDARDLRAPWRDLVLQQFAALVRRRLLKADCDVSGQGADRKEDSMQTTFKKRFCAEGFWMLLVLVPDCTGT